MKAIIPCFTAMLAIGAATSTADAAVITVGAGGGYDFTTLAAAVGAAQANDDIRIAAGTYLNDFATVVIPLTIEGVGGPVVLQDTILIPNGKAILVIWADVTVRNITFSGAHVFDGNGAGIRAETGNLIVDGGTFLNNQDGILSAGDPTANITVLNSTFIGNGAGDGFTHAIYAGAIDTQTVANSTFAGTLVGHDIKSRAHVTVITNNVLDDGVSGTPSYAIDIPNGGVATITGNTITQGVNTNNPAMIAYGAEGDIYAVSSLFIANNTFVNTLPHGSVGIFNHTADVLAVLQNNTFIGVETPLRGPGGTPAPAPEPATASIFGLGLAGMAIRRRRAAVI